MPRRPRIRTVDEARELVRQGGRVYRDTVENRILIRMPDGTTYRLPYDESLFDELKALQREVQEEGAPEGERPHRERRTPVTDAQLWNTWIKKERPLVEDLIRRISWFQSAVLEIGANTLLLVFLMTEPAEVEKLPDIVKKVKDRDEFVNFVMNRLVDIYAASRGAEEVMEMRERVRELMAENAFLENLVYGLKARVDDLERKLAIAQACMCGRDLRKYAQVLTLHYYGQYLVSPPAPPKEKPESESEGGGGE